MMNRRSFLGRLLIGALAVTGIPALVARGYSLIRPKVDVVLRDDPFSDAKTLKVRVLYRGTKYGGLVRVLPEDFKDGFIWNRVSLVAGSVRRTLHTICGLSWDDANDLSVKARKEALQLLGLPNLNGFHDWTGAAGNADIEDPRNWTPRGELDSGPRWTAQSPSVLS